MDNRADPVDNLGAIAARDVAPRPAASVPARDASLDTAPTLGGTAAPPRGRGAAWSVPSPLGTPDSHLSERLLLRGYGLDPDDLELERIRR